MKIQTPLRSKNPRKQVSTRASQEINSAIEHTKKKFDVSKSFIIAVALAEFFNIKSQERF